LVESSKLKKVDALLLDTCTGAGNFVLSLRGDFYLSQVDNFDTLTERRVAFNFSRTNTTLEQHM
ncbi:7414_t:CDS:2, partial [Cetraspora pellucida]